MPGLLARAVGCSRTAAGDGDCQASAAAGEENWWLKNLLIAPSDSGRGQGLGMPLSCGLLDGFNPLLPLRFPSSVPACEMVTTTKVAVLHRAAL